MSLFNRCKRIKKNSTQSEIVKVVVTYDVDAPIKEYTEEQITQRINDELGQEAVDQYRGCHGYKKNYEHDRHPQTIEGFLYSMGLRCYDYEHEIDYEYFKNKFFKQAIVRKSKKLYYDEVKESIGGNKEITKQQIIEGLAKIDEAAEKIVQELKRQDEIKQKNAELLPEIDKLFEDELN